MRLGGQRHKERTHSRRIWKKHWEVIRSTSSRTTLHRGRTKTVGNPSVSQSRAPRSTTAATTVTRARLGTNATPSSQKRACQRGAAERTALLPSPAKPSSAAAADLRRRPWPPSLTAEAAVAGLEAKV